MEPAIFTHFDKDMPLDRAVEMIRQAGFPTLALPGHLKQAGYDTPDGQQEVGKIIEKSGLKVESVHAPFPDADNLCSFDDSKRARSVRLCQSAIDTAELFNAGAVTIHLIGKQKLLFKQYSAGNPEMLQKLIDNGRRSVSDLALYAEEQGIHLAIENGQKRAFDRVLELFLKEFDEPVGLCYDTGHGKVSGDNLNLLKKHADRLLGFHIHDNSGRCDEHRLPYEGDIDWDSFCAVVKKLGLAHDMVIESGPGRSKFEEPVEFLSEARVRAERLVAQAKRSDN